MITIAFKQSRSKKIGEIFGLANKFESFETVEDRHIVNVYLKEIFEKWDWFSVLYIAVIKWAGTTIKYNGMTYHSSRDQKKIYYAVQQAKYNQINHETFRLVQIYRVYESKKLFDVKLHGISQGYFLLMCCCSLPK